MLGTIRTTLAVAAAEVRTARRSTRTWVFVVLGAGTALGAYGYYFYVHGLMSAFMPVAGYYSPRFQAAAINVYVLWVFVAAAAFLAFDIGARNVRARIADVVDSRPVSNLTLLVGRLIGVLCVAWLPIVVIVVLLQLAAWLARDSGWWFGEPAEPVAQTAFVLLDSLPILIFWIAFVLLLDAVARNRLVVILAALAVLTLQVWAYGSAPAYLYGPLSPLSAQVGWASDMVPRFMDVEMAVQRGALVLFAAAFVGFASVAHTRADGASRRGRLGTAVALAVAGGSGVAWAGLQGAEDLNVRAHWRAVHEEVDALHGFPDVERIAGDIVLLPGVQLEMDLRMTLAKSAGSTRLIFSFNPGLRIERLSAGGQAVPFTHEDGLLVIDLPRSSSARDGATIRLKAVGIPDPRFAYLDSGVEWRQRPSDSPLALLGTEPSLFDRRFVALMPGVAWLPVAGVNLARPGAHTDFFHADLTVEAPRGWLVVGPGRREEVDRGNANSTRFRPTWAVSEVGLIAGRFERFANTVADVQVELLLHPGHLDSVAYFAEATDALAGRIEQLFGEAQAHGIPYPLDSLSVVEVPAHLRGYRGGWRMGTAMALPGVLLVKEQGPPTASFRSRLRNVRPGEVDAAMHKLGVLQVLAANDVSTGADMYGGLAHNLFAAFTHARGHGADAINLVCAELTYRILVNNRVPFSRGFSAHRFDFDAAFGGAIWHTGRGIVMGRPTIQPILLPAGLVGRSSVWSLLSTVSPADFERHIDAKLAEDAMLLRGTSVALTMYDGLGRSGVGALLAELRRRFAGRTFDADEFSAAAEGAGVDLNALLGDWLRSPGLPGFLVDEARVVRLADDAGRQRYQVRVHVRNDEPVPGLVRVSTDQPGFITRGSAPIRVPATASMEVGLVLSEPPDQLWLHSYGSQNRRSIRVRLPDFDPVEVVRQEPLEGGRPSNWRPRSRGIVVDDLDAGFEVVGNHSGPRIGVFGSGDFGWQVDVDQGLPVREQQRGDWFRPPVPSAWGKYRQTAALVSPGSGDQQVMFEARLGGPGRWQLAYHIPDRHLPPLPARPGGATTVFGALGSVDMRLESGGLETLIWFDAGAAEVGWNKVGEFDLAHGNVRLIVTNRTDGETVVADAIRWSRVDG